MYVIAERWHRGVRRERVGVSAPRGGGGGAGICHAHSSTVHHNPLTVDLGHMHVSADHLRFRYQHMQSSIRPLLGTILDLLRILSPSSVKQIPVRSSLQLFSRISQIWLPVYSRITECQSGPQSCWMITHQSRVPPQPAGPCKNNSTSLVQQAQAQIGCHCRPARCWQLRWGRSQTIR